MARIRHIVLYTEDLDKEAMFYCKELDLTQKKETASGAIYLSEGYTHLAPLKRRGTVKPGLRPSGFEVEGLKRVQEHLRWIKPNIEFLEPYAEVAFAECETNDPDGNPFDISEKGWEV
jgi:catechol 2,3-dioxygenase-like lactoylglutathione lyase family enzyme